MSSYVHRSHFLKFADDNKCCLHISIYSIWLQCPAGRCHCSIHLVQGFNLDFNLKKFVHLSIKHKLDPTYTISDTHIPHSDSHQDFGLILSEDLCWDKHYRVITACANKVLGLKCHTFLFCHLTSTMVRLYVSLVQSQFFTVLKYGIPITLNISSSVLPSTY